MSYDYKSKKVVAVLSSELETGTALNVVGHLAISIGVNSKDLMGRTELQDGSGFSHLGIAKYPFIITKLRPSKLKGLIDQVRNQNDILMVDFPEQMLHTRHDDELAASLASAKQEEIKYLGLALYGEAKIIDRLTGKFTLWH